MIAPESSPAAGVTVSSDLAPAFAKLTENWREIDGLASAASRLSMVLFNMFLGDT